MPGVNPDPIADPEGPASVEGGPTDRNPAGAHRGYMGPGGVLKRVGGPK